MRNWLLVFSKIKTIFLILFFHIVVNAFSSLLEDVNREILSSINENENVLALVEDEVPLLG